MTATMIRGSLDCPPRFGTPRTSRPSLGPVVGEIAARVGTPFMPWQQHVVDVAFEQNPDDSLVYGKVILAVGRQEGKTAAKFVVMMHRLVVMAQTHGPQRVTYTMQNRLKARTRLERDYAVRLRSSRGFREIPSKSRDRPTRQTQWRLGMNSGTEHIQFGPSSYMQIDTPSRAGGHGDTLDAGFIDEAFAHEDDTVEIGMEPALLIPADPQLWVMSAAGDAKSKYFWRQILALRKLIEEGADTGTCGFEWSAPEDSNPGDPRTWAGACPALGIIHADGGGLTEAKLARLWEAAQRNGQEGIDRFCRSYLCMWPEVPVLDGDVRFRVIPEPAWVDGENQNHRPSGRLVYALDVDQNAKGEEWCSVGTSDGEYIQDVTPPDAEAGTAWVVPAVIARKDTVGELLVDPDGPAGKLIAPLEQAGITVRKIRSQERTQASMHFADRVDRRLVKHLGQPRLNMAVGGVARRDVGDGSWVFSRKLSTVDISTLNAVAFALWGSQVIEDESEPHVW